jgi:AGZA family xanthine/uracil permease-like MFS transporter
MPIGAQAFQETLRNHAPAVVLSMVPKVAAWGKLQIDSALGAAGTNAAAVGLDKLGQVGVTYHGLEILGSGAILVSLILAAVSACIIDHAYRRASGYVASGAVLTFFGFMHSEAIGIAKMPWVAVSHLIVAGVLLWCARAGSAMPDSNTLPDNHAGSGVASK